MARRIPTRKKKHLFQRPMTRRKAARRRETKTRIPRRRRLVRAITVRRRVTLRQTAGRRKFAKRRDAKTEKAGAAIEEEHLLSFVDVECEYDNDKGVMCFDISKAFYIVPIIDVASQECVEQNRISAKKPATDRGTGRIRRPHMTTNSGLGSARLARRTWQVGEARNNRPKQ